MKKYRNPDIRPDSARIAKRMCLLLACGLIGFGFVLNTPQELLRGLYTIITSRAVLVSDYFKLASIGAAFVNAGIVMLMSIGLIFLMRAPFGGSTVAALFLMPGFALFGKNPVNILPFFLGVFLYARFMNEPMRKYTAAALYSTSLAPIVSDLMVLGPFSTPVNILVAALAGAFIGFIIVPIAQHLFQMHRGYNLFNFGFACGVFAYVYNCIARALHLNITLEAYWYEGAHPSVLYFLLILCAALLLFGCYFSGWRFKQYFQILGHHGKTNADQIDTHGIGATMINMGFVGLLSLGYIGLIGGDLSGPIVGGILTAIGFAAVGTHPVNLFPLMFGVWLASSPTATAHATVPVIQMAVIYGATALAPIANEFGPFMGVFAGFLHFALVYTTGSGTGGFNLYNNGFAAGLVAAVLVTLLHAFLPRLSMINQRRIMRFLVLKGNKPRKSRRKKQQEEGTAAPPSAAEAPTVGAPQAMQAEGVQLP